MHLNRNLITGQPHLSGLSHLDLLRQLIVSAVKYQLLAGSDIHHLAVD